MKKKYIAPIAVGLAVILAFGSWLLFWNSHVRIAGRFYPKGEKTLDVRSDGLEYSDYLSLCAALPETEVVWEYPFQGTSYSMNTETVTVSALTEEQIAELDVLSCLKDVDALSCRDYDALLALQQRRPELTVRYAVEGMSGLWQQDAVTITVQNGDAAEMIELLRYLPELKTVQLEGDPVSRQELEPLREAYPNVEFRQDAVFGSHRWHYDETALDLRDAMPEDSSQLEELMDSLPFLEEVNLSGCRMSVDAMKHLTERFPEVRILWDVELMGQYYPSDTEEIDLSGNPMTDMAELENVLPFFQNLRKVDMCGCGLDSDTMESLNQRHPGIQFVWEVQIGWRKLRTDITWFMPYKMDIIATTENLYNLRYCTAVECVDIGHFDVSNCDWAVFMPNLRYLIIGDTPISDLSPLKDLKNLVYLEAFKTKVTDYSPLLGCTGLEDLNLGYTYGDPEPITQMTWLKHLWWHRPTPPWGGPEYEERLKLAETLPDCFVDVRYTNGSTDDGWRKIPNYFAMRDFLGMFYMED